MRLQELKRTLVYMEDNPDIQHRCCYIRDIINNEICVCTCINCKYLFTRVAEEELFVYG